MGSARAGGQRREWRSARGRGPAAPGGRLAANHRPPPAHAPSARGERGGRGERGREGPSGWCPKPPKPPKHPQNPRSAAIPHPRLHRQSRGPGPSRSRGCDASLAARPAPRKGQACPALPALSSAPARGIPSGIAGAAGSQGSETGLFYSLRISGPSLLSEKIRARVSSAPCGAPTPGAGKFSTAGLGPGEETRHEGLDPSWLRRFLSLDLPC